MSTTANGAPQWHPYVPETAPAPGETLRETLDALGMSQSKLAQRTGLSVKHINQIVLGTASISPETSLALERATGVPTSIWNSLEARFQDIKLRNAEADELATHLHWAEQMPLTELRARGCISADRREPGPLVQELLSFFGVASIEAWETIWQEPAAAFRQSRKLTASPTATAAWLRIGELEARNIQCADFDKVELRAAVHELRGLTRVPHADIHTRLTEECAALGIALVIVPDIPKSRAAGAARFLSPTKALIQLSNRGKRDDIFWFSFFHEIGHLLLHSKKETFVALDKEPGDTPQAELEADAFAATALIPREHASELQTIQTPAQATALADRLGISPSIVAGRIRRDRNDWKFGQSLSHSLSF